MQVYYLNELPDREAEFREKLRVAQYQLEAVIKQQLECTHIWGEPVSVKIFTGNFNPAHLGGPLPQPIKEYPHSHWSRACKKCGLVQHAHTTKEITQVVPDFYELPP